MKKIFLYEKEVALILEQNDQESAKEMYERIVGKLDSLNNRMNKITLYLIVCICIYPLASTKALVSLSIGPFGLNNFTWISKGIPVVFAYLCSEYALSASHQRQLVEVCKQLIRSIYKDNTDGEILARGNYITFLANILLPFTLLTQISRLANLKGSNISGIFLLLLWLPLMVIYFIPVAIQIYFLYDLNQKYQSDWWTIMSIAVSIWFFLLVAIYYWRHGEHDNKLKSQDV